MKHEPNRRPLFWIFAVTFFILYVFFKYNSAFLIEDLFNQQSFPFLNKLAATSENQNLAYYQGRIEENMTGPLASVFGGLIFLGFSLVFLKKSSTLKFGLATLIFLLITKHEVLLFPPWGDHVGGSLEEAVWLARNNFNYVELFHQPGSIYGGPKYFLFSIYPGIVAFLIKFFPTDWIAIAHLLTFAFAAVIVAFLREILLKLFDETTALFTSLFLLALPLYQTMIEMINMDMTSTFFAFLSAYWLIQKRLGLATFMAIIAVWVKGSGAASCGAIFITCLGLFFFSKDFQNKPKLLFYGILALLMAFLQVFLRSKFVHTVDMHHNSVKFLCGLPHFMGNQYLTHFFFFSLVGIAIVFWKEKLNLPLFFNKHYIAIVMFIQSVCWFLLHLNVSVMGPRYKLTLAPFLLFGVVFAYIVIFKNKTLIKISLVIAIIISFFSVYGFLEKDRVDSHYYAYGPLERSLEYRNDMKLHMKLVKEFKTNFPGFTIGAPHVTAQMLAFPEYGYVKEPLNVLMYGMNITFGGIKNFNGLQELDLRKTIWIGFRETDPLQFDYPIDAQDKIIKVVNVGDKKATLFMGGIALQKKYMMIILKKMGRI
jgi:hypothetical protein